MKFHRKVGHEPWFIEYDEMSFIPERKGHKDYRYNEISAYPIHLFNLYSVADGALRGEAHIPFSGCRAGGHGGFGAFERSDGVRIFMGELDPEKLIILEF